MHIDEQSIFPVVQNHSQVFFYTEGNKTVVVQYAQKTLKTQNRQGGKTNVQKDVFSHGAGYYVVQSHEIDGKTG